LSECVIIGSSSARSDPVSGRERTDGRFRYATSSIGFSRLADGNVWNACHPSQRRRVQIANAITPWRCSAYRIAARTCGVQTWVRRAAAAPEVAAIPAARAASANAAASRFRRTGKRTLIPAAAGSAGWENSPRAETANHGLDLSERIAAWQAGFVAERPLPS
jgi:hypothetical protein